MSSMERVDWPEWETFLENNYHLLSRRLRVESLLTRLRSDSVLSQDDQEMILNKYCTQFLKAGHLLDIVKTKDRTGFVKFMEAVEYEYPDVYQETTGIKPRPNPDSKESRRRPGITSALVLDKMGDLIHTFTKQISEKQSELKQFEAMVTQLKADLEKQSDDQKIMEDRIRHLEEIIHELREEKKELAESLSKERRLREEIDEKYDEFRNKKLNECYTLSRQAIRPCFSLDPNMNAPVSSVKTSPSSPSPPVSRGPSSPANKGKVQMLRNAYEMGKHPPCQPEAEVTPEDEKKTGSESDRTSADVKMLEETCCQLQESNNRLQCCIEEFKKETEESRLKQLEAEALSREAAAENEKMKAEMREMEAQCKLMADTVRRLKNEIDSRPPKPKKSFLIPQMFPESRSCGDDDESQSSQDTSGPDIGAPCQQGSENQKQRSPRVDEKRTVFKTAPATNTLLQKSVELFTNPWQSVGN